MKKFLFLITVFLFTQFCATAQTQQGGWTVSGATDLNFLFSKAKPAITDDAPDQTKKTQDYRYNLGVGYFVADGLSINLSGSYIYSFSREQFNRVDQTTWGVIPSVAYFFPIEGNVKPTIEIGYGYLTSKQRDNQISDPDFIVSHFTGATLNFAAGAAIFINESVSLNLGLQYSRNKLKDKLDSHLSQLQKLYGFTAGVSIYF